MDAIIERCCGLDVHKATVVACLLVSDGNRKPKKVIRTYSTVTRSLKELREWLVSEGCTHVGMESTGVYWMPVYAALEGAFTLVVGNAQHIRNVPGRKTDVKDSEWLADLVRHGLISPSFVPPKPIRELRELLRYRRKLVETRTAERNRLLKLLESASIKLASVASDVFGVSGMRMLKAILEGGHTPAEIANLAKGQLRKKLQELELALEGCIGDAQRFLLRMQLRRLDSADADIKELDRELDSRLEPYRVKHTLLLGIPGVDWYVAAVIIAETGGDMTVFQSEGRLAAWAGVCPGNHESAGKQKHGRSRMGNVHLTTALVTAAISAARTKGTYFRNKYHRLKAKRGGMRAAMAIGHKILVAAYHMLAQGVPYRDLGEAYLDELAQQRVTTNLVRRLERLGHVVMLTPRASPDGVHAQEVDAVA